MIMECAFVHVGPREYNQGIPQLMQIQTALVGAFRGYILWAQHKAM
jgi:hypothetical protein